MTLRLKIVLGILMIFAGFLLVRLVLIFKNNIDFSKATAETVNSVGDTVFKSENPFTKDSDGDGISDRDEVIYGTDPFAKDTDGDRFIDGEEIKSGHDPLDSSSNDKTGSVGISIISPTANLTDRLLNTSLAALINNQGSLDPTQMTTQKLANIIQDIDIQGALYFNISPPDDSDIRIIQDNGPESIKKYLNTVSPIIEEGIFSSTGNASGVSNGIVQEADYYYRTYNSLKIVEVPSSWKEIHRQALAAFLKLSELFKSLTDDAINDDPIKASLALGQIQSSFLKLHELLAEASRLAKSQNVSTGNSIIEILQSGI